MLNWKIIKKNVFTVFNLLNVGIAFGLFLVGAYSNMLFMAIIILNTLIGIAQEIKAKKMVEELSLLNRPQCSVLREGKELTVPLEEVAEGDILVLQSGNQITHDAVVLDGGSLEVDESLLTGESDGVAKAAGEHLLSGSFVISGKGQAKVLHTEGQGYADQMAEEVKTEKEIGSELLQSMRKVTYMTSFLIVPLGVLLFMEALFVRWEPVETSVVSVAAALLGMLPKGLVLLISVSLAIGVIRLSKKNILVKDIYSLETLARADVICLDKTGTITKGEMRAKRICPLWEEQTEHMEQWASWLVRIYLSACDDNNATFHALKDVFLDQRNGKTEYVPAGRKIPFSSKRKWGAVEFPGVGNVFVGAPERFFHRFPETIETMLAEGCRVVVIGYGKSLGKQTEERKDGSLWGNKLPEGVIPLYAVALEDQIRTNARETLEYFRKEGVEVKVISGDHEKTVALAAKRAGLPDWRKSVDLSRLDGRPDYNRIVREYSVFARVTPQQKRELVQALKRQGHSVAMAGDGVNDLLALREADCSIAIGEGSDASRQISQIVLLDSDFTYIPQVVLEGRRVVNHITRTAGVFFIKTIYSVLVSVLCILYNIPFPFIPIQITLVDGFVEALPSFLRVLESDTRKIEGSLLRQAITHAFPFALSVTLEIGVISLTAPFSETDGRTVMYLLLGLISMMAVVRSCVPFTWQRTVVCGLMATGFFGALLAVPGLFEVGNVTGKMAGYIVAGLLATVPIAAVWDIVFVDKGKKRYKLECKEQGD